SNLNWEKPPHMRTVIGVHRFAQSRGSARDMVWISRSLTSQCSLTFVLPFIGTPK
ncbi:hypothetical protein MCOR02_012022, partial [Pyricularia oryzae]